MSLPFAPKLIISQDQSGNPLTATDGSNYGTNSQGINAADIITRVVTIYDQNNVLLQTVNMALNTPFNYPISADGFFRFHNAFSTAAPVLYESDNKYLSTQFYKQAQLNLAPKLRCSCPANEKLIRFMAIATELYNAAVNAFIVGDDINAALNIADCNIYINKALTC